MARKVKSSAKNAAKQIPKKARILLLIAFGFLFCKLITSIPRLEPAVTPTVWLTFGFISLVLLWIETGCQITTRPKIFREVICDASYKLTAGALVKRAGQLADVKIESEDMPVGWWKYFSGSLTLDLADDTRLVLAVPKELAEVQLLSQTSRKDTKSVITMGAVGAFSAGSLGEMGGQALAQNTNEVALLCKMKDGRRFLARCDERIYHQWLLLREDLSNSSDGARGKTDSLAVATEIEKLTRLRTSGVLSDEEFEKAKARLLS